MLRQAAAPRKSLPAYITHEDPRSSTDCGGEPRSVELKQPSVSGEHFFLPAVSRHMAQHIAFLAERLLAAPPLGDGVHVGTVPRLAGRLCAFHGMAHILVPQQSIVPRKLLLAHIAPVHLCLRTDISRERRPVGFQQAAALDDRFFVPAMYRHMPRHVSGLTGGRSAAQLGNRVDVVAEQRRFGCACALALIVHLWRTGVVNKRDLRLGPRRL